MFASTVQLEEDKMSLEEELKEKNELALQLTSHSDQPPSNVGGLCC